MGSNLRNAALLLLILAPQARAETWPPRPTAHYGSLEAARDAIGAIVRRNAAAADTAVHVGGPDSVRFEYIYAKGGARGWAFRVVVNDTTECPNETIGSALLAAGWVESFAYGADGPDGSDMGYLSQNYFCLVEATWAGEDGTDESYVPPPGCKVTVTCVPRREDDVPQQ